MDTGVIDFAKDGGRQAFIAEGVMDEEGKEGGRTDGGNLIQRAKDAGYQYAWNTETANALNLDGTKPVLRLMEASHMKYSYDRTDADEPSPAEMTKMAIDYLGNDVDGFYLEIEAGRVDPVNHGGNAYWMMTDRLVFADAVRMIDGMTDDVDTRIIVPADHEHSIAINCYCGRGPPIDGLRCDIASEGIMHTDESVLADDGKPYSAIGHLNGPGSVLREEVLDPANATATKGAADVGAAATGDAAVPVFSGARPDVTDEEAMAPDYPQQTLLPKSPGSQSPEDVAVHAKGPTPSSSTARSCRT